MHENRKLSGSEEDDRDPGYWNASHLDQFLLPINSTGSPAELLATMVQRELFTPADPAPSSTD